MKVVKSVSLDFELVDLIERNKIPLSEIVNLLLSEHLNEYVIGVLKKREESQEKESFEEKTRLNNTCRICGVFYHNRTSFADFKLKLCKNCYNPANPDVIALIREALKKEQPSPPPAPLPGGEE